MLLESLYHWKKIKNVPVRLFFAGEGSATLFKDTIVGYLWEVDSFNVRALNKEKVNLAMPILLKCTWRMEVAVQMKMKVCEK